MSLIVYSKYQNVHENTCDRKLIWTHMKMWKAKLMLCSRSCQFVKIVLRHQTSFMQLYNVSIGNRCKSDCRSRGHEFHPVLWRLIMKQFLRSFSSLRLNHSRRVVVSYKQKYVHEVLINCLFRSSLPRKKCG